MAEQKKENLTGLFRDNPKTPEGKYCVLRRDGSVVEWPSFVIGARDPMSPWALRAYAVFAIIFGYGWRWPYRIWKLAAEFRQYRREHGKGDPEKGAHRKDDPATIALMRQGRSS